VAVDHDRVGTAHADLAATDGGRIAVGIGHGNRARADGGVVAVGIAHAGAIGRDRGDVAFVVLHRGAVGGHRGDIAVGIGHHQAVGVQHRVARGHAVHGDVIGQVEGDVVAVIGLGDHDVAVGVVQVHGVAGLAVDAHVGR